MASRSARSTSCFAIRRTASGSRSPPGSRTGCTRSAPIWPTATWRATSTASSASWPTASVSPTRSASTPARSGCTWSRPPAAASRACASTRTASRWSARSSGRRAWAKERGRTASPSIATAISGARWSTRTSCSCSRRRAISASCWTKAIPKRWTRSNRRFSKAQVNHDVLFATGRGVAPWMASVTFGGPDLRTAYIGSLRGSRIPYFRAPVPGLPMVHWKAG